MWKFNKDNWVYIAEDNIEDFLKNGGNAVEKVVEQISEKPKKRSKKAKTAIQT